MTQKIAETVALYCSVASAAAIVLFFLTLATMYSVTEDSTAAAVLISIAAAMLIGAIVLGFVALFANEVAR